MKTLSIAGIIRESIVDGPGIRFVVFAQGCPRRCPGCHNPQTWSYEGGRAVEPERIMEEVRKNPLLKGITLSGGEPFCQCGPMAALAALAHEYGLDVVTFTGYTFEQLLERSSREPEVHDLLRQTDLLVDGPFVQEQKSYDLLYRGSANQRLLDAKQSLLLGRAVEYPLENAEF